jgi:hypothetical protein
MAGAATREEEGEGSRRTGISPGTRRWCRIGRRWVGGGEFSGGGARFPARYPRRWRRFRPPRLDSFNGEIEDGDADLLSMSAGLGRARDGDAMCRPWWLSSCTGRIHVRKRETEGKMESGQGIGRKGGGEAWRPAASSGGLLGGQSEQEVARPRPGGLHAPVSYDST